MMTLQEFVDEARSLPLATRKQLLKALVDLLDEPPLVMPQVSGSLRQYRGAGAHAYDGQDAQVQVDEMRRDWDERP